MTTTLTQHIGLHVLLAGLTAVSFSQPLRAEFTGELGRELHDNPILAGGFYQRLGSAGDILEAVELEVVQRQDGLHVVGEGFLTYPGSSDGAIFVEIDSILRLEGEGALGFGIEEFGDKVHHLVLQAQGNEKRCELIRFDMPKLSQSTEPKSIVDFVLQAPALLSQISLAQRVMLLGDGNVQKPSLTIDIPNGYFEYRASDNPEHFQVAIFLDRTLTPPGRLMAVSHRYDLELMADLGEMTFRPFAPSAF